MVSIKCKWSTYQGLDQFTQFLFKEWVDGRFKKWRLFGTPPGVVTTNSGNESWNKQLKNVYTGYEIVSVYKFLCIVIDKLINQASYQPDEFKFYRSPDFDMITKARELLDMDFPFMEEGFFQNSKYYSFNNKYRLVVEDNLIYQGYKFVSCQCISYNESFVCKHTIALAIKLNLKLKGFEVKQNETLVMNNRRGRQPKATPALMKMDATTKPPSGYKKKN